MALLSRMMRTVAVTGSTDSINDWCVDRQTGRWAKQTVGAAFPWARPGPRRAPPALRESSRTDPAETLRELTELHQLGVVTDAEFEGLRDRLGV
jgi:hypothetical protein